MEPPNYIYNSDFADSMSLSTDVRSQADLYPWCHMSNRMTKITAFAVITIILATGSLMSSSYALLEQVVKAQNMTANMTDPYLGNMSQADDSDGGRISSREPIACPMC